MSNSTYFLNINTNATLNQLLDKLGFTRLQTTTASFVLPVVNLFGMSFCSLSAWIFFRRKFIDPIYLFYRILCLVYILHLVHNFFYGILFVPRYFTQMSTYLSSLFHIYYFFMAGSLFLFEDLLQMGILCHRIKFFSPFLAKNFKVSPRIFSLLSFFACFINLPVIFSFKIVSLGSFYYLDSSGVKQMAMFYYFSRSSFGESTFGKILIGFLTFFLSLTFTLIAGIALNIFSILKFKKYTLQRRVEFEELEMSSIHNRPILNVETEQTE